MKLSTLLGVLAAALPLSEAMSLGGRPYHMIEGFDKRAGALQDFVTWDEYSLFIHGERAMMFSGEVHPFRLPVPGLYLDVFQKIKALGFNMVSFYVDWALLEGKRGEFRADGIFALEPFFDAAKEAGIYLLARPGPYINAEVSGGGFPGWLQGIDGYLRTSAPDFLSATDNYMKHVCSIIAKHQITNGGPIVLFQPENEYSSSINGPFPNGQYMQYVINQARSAGIFVPMINNDVAPNGNYAPGSGSGQMDIYGYDNYPLGFDCSHPSDWGTNRLPTNFHQLHEQQSPKTPLSIIEFQGGSFDPWGGPGFEKCTALLNHEFERVYYKNNFAAGVTIMNLYMIFGGTNWGNIGHPGGYASYDYGACIRENRLIDREKYSEVKLEAQFMKVSPGYITTDVGDASTTEYTDNPAVLVTPLTGANGTKGAFYIARQANYASQDSVQYSLKVNTSTGIITIPQRGGKLSLLGRDSKIHVVDYPVGNQNLLYSTAEVFTWKKIGSKTVLILYGGINELHEFAVNQPSAAKGPNSSLRVDGATVKTHQEGVSVVVQWQTSTKRQFVQVGALAIYLIDRNSAYNYWVPLVPGKDKSAYGTSLMNPDAVIVNGGYLIRSASVQGSTLNLSADFNKTSTIELVGGAPDGVKNLKINGKTTKYTTDSQGNWLASPSTTFPTISVPDLSKLDWYKVDSLPEVSAKYDDKPWVVADKPQNQTMREASHKTSNSTFRAFAAPVSLRASDYGFYSSAMLFRAHFTATGDESQVKLWTIGGTAYASSVWLGEKYLGSFKGSSGDENHNDTYPLPVLEPKKKYVLTVIVDSMGLNENFSPGYDDMKTPRGLFNWSITSKSGAVTPVTEWKITGNLGGQNYVDKFRGPLNEGGFFYERQGFHLPNPPVGSAPFSKGSPLTGFDHAGVAFYTAKLTLDLPTPEYDIPLSFVFDNGTRTGDYRAQVYVNGFQFGKYISYIGPQTEFPVPEGIFNYHGDNWIGVSIWAVSDAGARLPGFELKAGVPVLTGRKSVEVVDGPAFTKRPGAY